MKLHIILTHHVTRILNNEPSNVTFIHLNLLRLILIVTTYSNDLPFNYLLFPFLGITLCLQRKHWLMV
jgi:hypothetical protein